MTNNKQTWREKFDKKMFFNDLLLDYYEWSVAQAPATLSHNELQDEAKRIANHITKNKKDIEQFIEKTLQEQREEVRKAEKDRVVRIVTEYFEKGLGFNKGSMNDSVFEGLKDALLKELKK